MCVCVCVCVCVYSAWPFSPGCLRLLLCSDTLSPAAQSALRETGIMAVEVRTYLEAPSFVAICERDRGRGKERGGKGEGGREGGRERYRETETERNNLSKTHITGGSSPKKNRT